MKCKVCGKRFKAIAENKYIAIEKLGALEGLTKAPKIFECFDCIKCGCQNIVNIREESIEIKEREHNEQSI